MAPRDADSISHSLESPIFPSEVDVVVIGAGFSGLQAAWDVQKAGLTCVVLEAKHRVGGRSRSRKLEDGEGIIDLGAGWMCATTHTKVYGIVQRLGLEVVKQRAEGNDVLQMADGTIIKSDAKVGLKTILVLVNIAQLPNCGGSRTRQRNHWHSSPIWSNASMAGPKKSISGIQRLFLPN